VPLRSWQVAAIKAVERYFFEQKPRLSAELISHLFQGRLWLHCACQRERAVLCRAQEGEEGWSGADLRWLQIALARRQVSNVTAAW
jgi:hypothetical protein